VVAVVQADADELAGIGDGRVQPRGGRRDGHPFLDRGDGLRAGRAAFEELARGRRHQRGGDLLRADDAAGGQGGGDAGGEIGDAIALQRAEARGLPIGGEPDELHGWLPPDENVPGL